MNDWMMFIGLSLGAQLTNYYNKKQQRFSLLQVDRSDKNKAYNGPSSVYKKAVC